MTSAGDGEALAFDCETLRGFMLERLEVDAGPARAAAGGRDGGQLVRAVPGVTRARPSAVAAIGLRRSGRTGNGESPRGRIAPARQPGPPSSRPIPVRGSAPGTTRAARRTARSARP